MELKEIVRTPRLLKGAIRRLYDSAPRIQPVLQQVSDLVHPPHFWGWGLTTRHALPWDDEHDWAHLREAFEVARTFDHGDESETGISARNVDRLRWRHSIVASCTRYAVRFNPGPVSLVECGVGDGLSAFFTCIEATYQKAEFTLHCYDAWSAVRAEDFLTTEKLHQGGYSGLSLDRTRRNLQEFSDRIVYHPGHLPDTLQGAPQGPDVVAYLSIDLNAAKPTIATLDHFLPKMALGGIILFDDYGFEGYGATKAALDSYFKDRPGVLFKLPTGQAMYFCRS